MKWGSLRLKLTLWNLLILAISLAAFGALLTFGSAAWVRRQVDQDLTHRAVDMAGPPPPMGGYGNPPQGPPPEPPQEPPRPRHDPFPYLRRPQRFDIQGNPAGIDRNPVLDRAAFQRAANSWLPQFSDPTVNGEHLRVLYMPFNNRRSGQPEIVQTARPMGDYDALARSQITALLILLPVAVLAAGLGALFLTNRALKPVSDLTKAAAEMSASDLSRRLAVKGQDELAELARTFNGMLARLEGSFKSLEEAYDAQKRFTADASHELRTPLTRLKLATSSALQSGDDVAALHAALKTADDAGDAMTKLVKELLVLSRADTGNLNLRHDIVDLRLPVSDGVSTVPNKRATRLQVSLPKEPVMIDGDAEHLRRVVINLVDNAFRHTPSSGQVSVTLTPDANLQVADTGEGIAPEHLAHVFDRFYRVDSARARDDGGTGLGLSICKSIVEAHGGTIAVESEVGKGTTVTVAFRVLKG